MDTNILTTIIVGVFGIISVAIPFILGRDRRSPTTERKAEEDRAVEATQTPDSPEISNQRAYELANQATADVLKLSREVRDTHERMLAVEAKLDVVTRSYESLYKWSLRLIDKWHEYRRYETPPPLPDDLHHL